MHFESDRLYHVYNRGNNRNPIFIHENNYRYFLRKVIIEILPFSHILAYCLMPNHFHFLLYVKELFENDHAIHPLSRKIGTLLSSYSFAINNRYGFTGSLFQQRTKAKTFEEDLGYGSLCIHYIHQNPLKAGLVRRLEEWEFSSYREYMGLSNENIVNIEFALSLLDLPLNRYDFEKLSYNDFNEKLFY